MTYVDEITDVIGGKRRWSVINADAMIALDSVPNESVDALITDPPYGIGKTYAGKKEVANQADEYWEWLQPFYEKALTKVKPGGFVAVWQTQLYFQNFWKWFGNDIHIYAAAKNFVQIRKVPINYAYDPVVMFFKPGATPLRPVKPSRSFDFFVANTAATFRNKRNRYLRRHPCPRPLDQCVEIVRNFTQQNGVILDPFSGAGTIGAAALELDRRYIGVELSADYVNDLSKPWLTEVEAEIQAGAIQ